MTKSEGFLGILEALLLYGFLNRPSTSALFAFQDDLIGAVIEKEDVASRNVTQAVAL